MFSLHCCLTANHAMLNELTIMMNDCVLCFMIGLRCECQDLYKITQDFGGTDIKCEKCPDGKVNVHTCFIQWYIVLTNCTYYLTNQLCIVFSDELFFKFYTNLAAEECNLIVVVLFVCKMHTCI